MLGDDGALHGTTPSGGSSDVGTVFKIDSAGTFTSLHSFSGEDGSFSEWVCGYGCARYVYPSSALVQGSDGALYGTTPAGGSSGVGTVFKIDSAGTFTSLHSFSSADGANPSAALVLGSDGALYGTTQGGGGAGAGTVFKIDSAGIFTSLKWFSYEDGASPSAALVQGSDGALYGTAPNAGPVGYGVVYRIFEAGHLRQRIQFEPLPNRTLRDSPFTVTASASSGLPVSFRASGSCTVTGDQVTLTGVGLCTLTASQVGDADYQPALEVSQAFHVSPASLAIDIKPGSDTNPVNPFSRGVIPVAILGSDELRRERDRRLRRSRSDPTEQLLRTRRAVVRET